MAGRGTLHRGRVNYWRPDARPRSRRASALRDSDFWPVCAFSGYASLYRCGGFRGGSGFQRAPDMCSLHLHPVTISNNLVMNPQS